jgi:hypothetical protein
MSITDDIRERCALVARQAQSVRINPAAVEPYALSLPLHKAIAPTLDRNSHYVNDDDPAATAAFFVTLDAINFGSGYFPHLRKRPGMSGYFTVATSLKEAFERAGGAISAARLVELSADRCAEIFCQDPADAPVIELMGLFASALNDLGRLLLSQYHGRFENLIAAANHSAERLIDLLARMPFFRDVQRYGELDVPFYKRAQLTAADLSLALNRQGLGRFDDLDRLTIFADNLVPHVLRIDGLLTYDPDLADRIDREELITPGSAEEIEIRACAVHAVELIKEALARHGTSVTSMGLDYVLWNRGQERHYKTIRPRHRARTVYY